MSEIAADTNRIVAFPQAVAASPSTRTPPR